MGRVVSLAFVAAILVVTAHRVQAADKSSWYTELVPSRFLYSSATSRNKTETPPWPLFPSKQPGEQAAVVTEGVLILADGKVFLGQSFVPVDFKIPVPSGSKMVVTAAGVLLAIATPNMLCSLDCNLATSNSPSCTPVDCAKPSTPWGDILDVACGSDVTSHAVWVASQNGLSKVVLSTEKAIGRIVESILPSSGPIFAVAVNSPANTMAVAGNGEKLWFVDYKTNVVDRFEWVTDVQQKWGGVIDDRVTSLAFSPDNGDLFVGNPTKLDILYSSNGSVTSWGGDEGLPYNNITTLAFSRVESNGQGTITQLLIGTTMGLIIRQEGNDPLWRYLYGPRYLAGSSIVDLAVVPMLGREKEGLTGDTIVVVAQDGLTFLEQHKFTLEQKAQHFEAMLSERHNRLGLTSGCQMPRYGDVSTCISHDDDNNGLWSSLVTVAEYMGFLVTNNKERLARASSFFNGLVLLNEVTGKPGLMARSACSPTEVKLQTCMKGSWIHDKEIWYNSTNPAYRGYTWKGDTSSDESTGHIFGLAAVAHLSPIEEEKAKASELLNDIVTGIVRNNFQLIDITNKPTTWGKWDPMHVNHYRPWSDERGVQSMQIISYLAAAYSVGNETQRKIYERAYTELTNRSNSYNRNLNNLKITASCDDNYSDDELTFLPYHAFLSTCDRYNDNDTLFDKDAVFRGLNRSSEIVRPFRPNLWNTIFLAFSGKQENPLFDWLKGDIIWNLQTWPLDLIDWPVSNSHRIDLEYDRAATRVKQLKHAQTRHSRGPLPANERRQYRWNANPYIVADGGDGYSESDPGAWLLPYWMARYYGILES
jgi:hypothetical protein